MPLSPKELQSLHELTFSGKPNYEINGWLMEECGLSFLEAKEERRKAVEHCREVYAKTQEQNKASFQGEEGGSLPPEAQSVGEGAPVSRPLDEDKPGQEDSQEDKEATDTDADEKSEAGILEEIVHETEAGCVTCKDPTLSCDCTVKKVSDIPF